MRTYLYLIYYTDRRIKLLFFGLSITGLLLSCKAPKNENETLSKKVDTIDIKILSDEESKYASVERSLKYDISKFGLLAKCYNQSFDTLYTIIREYKFRTSSSSLGYISFQQPDNFKNAQSAIIDSIAKNFKLNKQTVARIVFAFEYEMITREEIGLKAVDSYKDEVGTSNQ